MPLRAHGVSTVAFTFVRPAGSKPSQSAKKNVLFFTMGPPTLPVYWLRFVHDRVAGTGCTLLFAHVLGSSALLRMFHTAAPWNLFVPDLVETWICAFPRPNSASTGERIMRTSPTRSG